MWKCERCGEIFSDDEADSREICYESEYGVGSMFPNWHYGSYMVCPNCGSEDFDTYHEESEGEE